MRRALPALALGLALLAGPAAAAPLTLALPHDALTVLPARVAAARGFFRDEGAAVRLLNVGTGSLAAAALAGGGVELALLPFAEVLRGLEDGRPFVVLLAALAPPPDVLVLTPGALAGRPERGGPLDGRIRSLATARLAAPRSGSAERLILRSLLGAGGMTEEDVVLVPGAAEGAAALRALSEGRVDGALLPGALSALAEHRGTGLAFIRAAEVPALEHSLHLVLAARREVLEEQREAVRGVVRGLRRAHRLLARGVGAAAAEARALYPGMEGRLVARAVAALQPAFPADPRVTAEQVEATIRLLARPGGAPSVSFDALVAGEFAAEEVSR
jgi:ABC-type nitrate/sulfonate/bicarbonate transport system substrate-binding protein